MKILHWYPNFLRGGGVSNSVLGLANAQARLGARVYVATTESVGPPLYGSVKEHIGGGVNLIKWKPRRILEKGNLVIRGMTRYDRKSLFSLRPDIVCVHGEFNPDNFKVSKLFSCPIVLSPHGAFHPVALRNRSKKLKRLYVAIAKRSLYKNMVFHALSPSEKEHIRKLLPAIPVYTVPQGVSVQMEEFLHSKQVNLPEDRDQSCSFFFAGRLDIYSKGLDIMIEAFVKAIKDLPHHRIILTLAGPEWNGSLIPLRNQIEAVSAKGSIRIIGTKIGSELAMEFSRNHIYIQVSRHEAHPSAVTEALCFGKPAILSNTIGTVSYKEISDMPHIKIIPPRVEQTTQAIINAVLNQRELRTRAKEKRGEILSFFSWDRVALMHLQNYEALGR